MSFGNLGDRVSDDPIDLELEPTVIENAGLPHIDKSLGSWKLLTFEDQYVYTFQVTDTVQDPPPAKKPKKPVPVKIFTTEYVRKSVLGGFHPYAPLQPHGTADIRHDAYYVKVPSKFLTNNLNDRSVTYSLEKVIVNLEHNEDIYVSLRYLQALAENQLAWNPLQVLDLDTKDRKDFYERDQEILKEQAKLSDSKQKVAEAARIKMRQLIQKAKEADIPTIETPVQVTAVTPEFDFYKRQNQTPIPLNDINEELGNYGMAGDMEKEALGSCLEEIHNMTICKRRFHGKEEDATTAIGKHFGECQEFKNFLKAVIPFRIESGKLCFGCHSPFPAGIKNDDPSRYQLNRKALNQMNYFHYGRLQRLWGEYWADSEAHKKPEATKSRGWRTRYDSSPLSKPLIIWLLPGARTRFYNTLNNGLEEGRKTSHPAGHAHEVFGKIISHINEREEKDTSRKHTKLQLAPEKGWSYSDYCLLSEDPFRLYQTYIHKGCIHEYMRGLEVAAEADAKKVEAIQPKNDGTMNLESLGTQQVVPATDKETKDLNPVRQLPFGLDQKYTVQKDEYEAKKKRFADYWPSDPNDIVVGMLDDRDEDEGESEYNSDEEESNPPAQRQEVVTAKTRTQVINEEDTRPIETKSKFEKEKEEKAGKPEPKKSMTRGIHVNPINAKKVIQAAGSRKGQKDQKAVMGFSASYFADKVLGWSWRPGPKATLKDRQMLNGLYIAEWLHLSAYSWGGIQQGTDASAQESSQTKENLVFGTSEANSCMTRHEKAWQQLFKDEKLLRDRLQAEQAKTSMVTDIEKYGKGDSATTHLQGELSVVCNTKSGPYLFDEYDKKTEKYVWREKYAIEEDSALAKLAEEFPFLAYNIRYEIRLMGQSRILAPLGASDTETAGTEHELPTILHTKAMFYPFSRRFYHRSEHLLDSALYQHMFMLGALDRFNGDRTLAEKVFGERFKKQKLSDYKSLEKLIKTNTEFASRGEARRDLDAQRQEGPMLTKQASQDLKDAEMRYRQMFISKARKNTSKAAYTFKWPKDNKAGQMKDETNLSESNGEANAGTLKKVPGQPKSQRILRSLGSTTCDG